MTIGNARKNNRLLRRMIGPAVLVIVLLFAALVVLGSMLPSRDNHQKITIILRYDDYSAVSNTHLEAQILEVLERHQLPCIFAVIPCVTTNGFRNAAPADSLVMSADKIALLKPYLDKGLIELCAHGCTHQTLPNRDLHELSEFVGRSYDDQVARLMHAKSTLEEQFGHTISTFVPPWGNYDTTTLRAAEAVGFSIISADPRGPVARDSRLLYVPGTCRIHQLSDAIHEARQLPSSASTLITAVIHPYDFIESDAARGVMTFSQFESLMAQISDEPDLQFASVVGATKLHSDLGADRLVNAASLRRSSMIHLVPEFLQFGYPTKSYVDPKLATTLLERERVWCVAIYLGMLVGAIMIANRSRTFLPAWVIARRKRLLTIGYILLALVAAYSLQDLQIYATGLTALVVSLGLLVGSTWE